MKALLLAGTTEARDIIAAAPRGVELIESVAGRTASSRPVGRRGGFGGVIGLVTYLRDEGIDAVVDATHPFAEQMTRNAVEACQQMNVPYVRVERASWAGHALAGTWTWVADHDEAAAVAAGAGRVMLAVGRQPLEHYLEVEDAVARMVEVPPGLPSTWTIVAAKGPFTRDNELELLRSQAIDVLVTKDSGGDASKLEAAAELGVKVVMIRRAPLPEGIEVVSSANEAVTWVERGLETTTR